MSSSFFDDESAGSLDDELKRLLGQAEPTDEKASAKAATPGEPEAASKKVAKKTGLKRYAVHSRASFVRKTVATIPITDFTIAEIMPYFPKSTKVIGGYVDNANQYWKVNWHWEYLLLYLDKFIASKVAASYKQRAKTIRATLKKHPPSPDKGYRSSKMGSPKDSSTRAAVVQRWRIVRKAKRDLKKVLDESKALKGLAKKERKRWLLAVAPIARPGRSKHSEGWALDLYGDNKLIERVSKGLGASLVFPEGSHIHVEFAKGVLGKRFGVAEKVDEVATPLDDIHYDEEAQACVLTPAEIAELQEAARQGQASGDFGTDVPMPAFLTDLVNDVLGEDWW